MRKRCFLICMASCFFVLHACQSNCIYNEYKEIPNYKWKMDNVLKFEIDIADTTAIYNLDFGIRNTGVYPYSNIWFFVTKTSPKGIVFNDKFEGTLANEKGEWLGSGFGNIYDLNIPYQQKISFLELGTYSFEIVHGMRDLELKGVANVGLKLEKEN